MILPRLTTLKKSVSVTTRKPSHEVDGEDYFFTSPEEFQRLVASGALLEHARVHGNFYGTPAAWVKEQLENGWDVILNIDVQGGLTIKRKCTHPVLIFVMPPSLQELERRLRQRGRDSEEEIRLRLRNAEQEMEKAVEYDYIVVNDDLDRAGAEMESLIARARAESPGTIVP
jgi:guanylate kinase